MAQLTVQQITGVGTVPAYMACNDGGDTYEPSDTTFLHVINDDTEQHTITVETTATAYGQQLENVVVEVAAGTDVMMGPYPAGEVADQQTGFASVGYDAVAGLTIAALTV